MFCMHTNVHTSYQLHTIYICTSVILVFVCRSSSVYVYVIYIYKLNRYDNVYVCMLTIFINVYILYINIDCEYSVVQYL